MERLRDVLMEDTEGLSERLDEDMQEAVEAYFDPWKEGENPVHKNQFVTTPATVAAEG